MTLNSVHSLNSSLRLLRKPFCVCNHLQIRCVIDPPFTIIVLNKIAFEETHV